MRKLDISPITDSKQLPIKKGTLQFLQDAYSEMLVAISTWIASTTGAAFSAGNAYILYGLFDAATFPAFDVPAGAVFYNGELYLIDATTFTLTGSNVPICTITTTQYGTNADPVTFTDATTGNVHNIRKIVISQGASGSGDFDFVDMIDASTVIWPKLSLTDGANTTVSGTYPSLQVNAPAPVPSPVLLKGTENVGNIPTTLSKTISLGITLPDSNYMVFGTIISIGTAVNDSTVIFAITARSTTDFDVMFHETAAVAQNVDFDWFIIHK